MARAATTVLVVDGDAVSRRFVEIHLGALPGWAVESAKDATGALDILRTTSVDAILSERSLPDMTGLQFHRRLMQESRLKLVPFIVLSSEARQEKKAVALRAGVDDYLVKPLEPLELQARVESHILRVRRSAELARLRRYLLAGDFSALSLPDLVSTLALQNRTGTISIATPRGAAEVFLDNGRVVHAVYGNLAGPNAFFALFAEPTAMFEFNPNDSPLNPTRHTITDSVTGLIMQAAQRIDEGGLQLPQDTKLAQRPSAPLSTTAQRQPEKSLAPQFASAFFDEFSLGEMFIWVGSELSNWTRREGSPERLHIHLVSALAASVSAMLPLASPLNERQVLAGLRSGSKAVGLVYFLRNERMLDLVGVDLENPAYLAHMLNRNPALTIIAPPNGDALEISPRAKVGIDALLSLRTPSLVVGVGNPSMQTFLDQLTARGSRTLLVPGALGDKQTDLRAVLKTAINAWAQES